METINGFIVSEIEMRFTPNGTVITKFEICKDKEETRSSKYDKIIAWAELGELANQYLAVFDNVYIKGYWKERQWKSPDNVIHTIKELTAKQIWIKENEKFFDLEKDMENEDFSRYAQQMLDAEDEEELSQDDLIDSDLPF